MYPKLSVREFPKCHAVGISGCDIFASANASRLRRYGFVELAGYEVEDGATQEPKLKRAKLEAAR